MKASNKTRNHRINRNPLVLAMATSSVLTGTLAIADSGAASVSGFMLEEIVVTAQKRSQSLQDVPISINAVGGEKLDQASIENLDDLANYVPNFTKFESGVGAIMKIRGIGSGANPGIERSVVLYMDDVSYSRATLANIPLLDLERVEVLRGPQNVLFGKNSIAGALSLTSARPTEEFEASLTGSYDARYDDKEITGVVSGAIVDGLRARLVVRGQESNGYFDNRYTGNDEQRRNSHTGRVTLAWDADQHTEVLLKVEQTRVDNRGEARELSLGYLNNGSNPNAPFTGMDYSQIAPLFETLAGYSPGALGHENIDMDRTRYSNLDENQVIDLQNIQLTINTNFEHFDLAAITGYVSYDEQRAGDTDGNGFSLFYQNMQEDYRQLSQEIRFSSNSSDNFEWIAGAYFQTSELESYDQVITPEFNLARAVFDTAGPGLGAPLSNKIFNTDFSTQSDMAAIFAQGTWALDDNFRLTIGARYTYEQKKGSRRVDTLNALTGAVNNSAVDYLTSITGPFPDLSNDIVANIAYSQFAGVDLESLGSFATANPELAPSMVAVATGLSTIYGGSAPTSFATHDINPERRERAFTPTIILEYDLDADHMMYASVSRGFKAGGFDAEASRASSEEFEDESVDAFELGLKSVWLNGRAESNLAVFYSQYSDLQSSAFNGRNFVVTNVGEAVTQGLELDGRWRLLESLTLTGSLAYTDLEFTQFENATCSASVKLSGADTSAGCDRTGDRDRSLSAGISLEYTHKLAGGLELRAALDANYQDQYLSDTAARDKLSEQDAYTLYNLRMGLQGERWSIALLGKNLLDEEIITFSAEVPFSYGLTGAPAYSSYLAPPRTVAVQFSYRM
jgi:outer membrane receptor protein involved in Fe transport